MVLDDEPTIGRAVQRNLTPERFKVELAYEVAPVLARLQAGNGDWDVVILDIGLPGEIDGIELLRRFRRSSAMTSVVMISGDDSANTATTCLHAGAFDYITKPFNPPMLSEVVFKAATHASMQRAINRQRITLDAEEAVSSALIGRSLAIQQTRAQIRQLALQSLTTPILIQGETGTGKELVARELHDQSERRHRPFVPVNCGALPESLIESELFGHIRGAFTGATSDRPGVFVEADGGTLVLDEIGDMPLSLQAKLLRVIQEREVRPVGSSTVRGVDVRIVAATHVNLHSAVARNQFREDLYYRLNVIGLTIPPLRERIEDIPELATHFLRKHVPLNEVPPQLDRSTLDLLMAFHWPGNVRQLENAVLHAHALRSGDIIYPEALPKWVTYRPRGTQVPSSPTSDDLETISEAKAKALADSELEPQVDPKTLPGEDLKQSRPRPSSGEPELVAEASSKELANDLEHMSEAKRKAVWLFEHGYIHRVLTLANGSVSEAARIAGLDRANFRRLLKSHAIDPNDYRPAK